MDTHIRENVFGIETKGYREGSVVSSEKCCPIIYYILEREMNWTFLFLYFIGNWDLLMNFHLSMDGCDAFAFSVYNIYVSIKSFSFTLYLLLFISTMQYNFSQLTAKKMPKLRVFMVGIGLLLYYIGTMAQWLQQTGKFDDEYFENAMLVYIYA